MKYTRFVLLFCVLAAGPSMSGQDAEQFIQLVRSNAQPDVESLLKAHPQLVDMTDAEGNTALIIAAYRGHADLVNLLAPLSKNINYRNGYGTALMAASVKGETRIAEILLNYGADPNATDPDATSALIFASMFKHESLALMLLDAGADPLHKNAKGFSALDYARMHELTTLIIRFENAKP